MLTFLFRKGWTPSILWVNKIKAWAHHAAMSWLTSLGQNLPGTRRAIYPKYFQLKTQVFDFQFLQTREWQQWQTCINVHTDLSFKDVWVQYLTQKYVCSISPLWSLPYIYTLVAYQANGAHGTQIRNEPIGGRLCCSDILRYQVTELVWLWFHSLLTEFGWGKTQY